MRLSGSGRWWIRGRGADTHSTDEAHKASGNHSYVQCVAYLQAHNPFFRIVALTATPGRTTDKVQDVVDALHISRIEIREAEAPEISKYMFKKVGWPGCVRGAVVLTDSFAQEIYQHRISLTDELQDIANRWARLMKVCLAGRCSHAAR